MPCPLYEGGGLLSHAPFFSCVPCHAGPAGAPGTRPGLRQLRLQPWLAHGAGSGHHGLLPTSPTRAGGCSAMAVYVWPCTVRLATGRLRARGIGLGLGGTRGLRAAGLGFRAGGYPRAAGCGLGVQGSGFRVWGSGVRAEGLGLWGVG